MNLRERLYAHYLSTQVRADTAALREALATRRPYLERLVARWIPPDRDQRILEIGCGWGAFLAVLREAGYRDLGGVDASPEQVAAAHALGLDFVREGALLDRLRATPDGSCDVVIAFDVLEHFTRAEALDLGDEIHRVLRAGGRLLLHVPNAEGIFPGRVLYGDLTHETAYTRQSLQQLLSVCGFARISFAEDVPVVHGAKSALRFVLWKLFRTFFRLIHAAETGELGRDLVLSQNLVAVAERDR
jgi:SAM-dependent methyltransferase